ncbi:KTSC domain-containing protein [Sphingomonas sp. IC-56]|nr:KTSC domain-containing protein [Sphingomonas sp. IC-56]
MIRNWRYHQAERRLDILFVSGRRYSYHQVPPRIAEEMQAALSKGGYFNRHIRDYFAFTEH